MAGKYRQLEETALANFELLLNLWGIKYTKITDYEYDFLSPTRKDENYGACRFNLQKGVGSDFAGAKFDERELKRFGFGFTEDDFAGYSNDLFGDGRFDRGFNIIGLCQRIYKTRDYRTTCEILKNDLRKIEINPEYKLITEAYIKHQEELREERKKKSQIKANKLWDIHKRIEGTLGEKYLNNRGIILDNEENVGFHPRVYHPELKRYNPALLLAVRRQPDSEIVATHRIFIDENGFKLRDVEAKMIVGPLLGNGIWFGKSSEELYIVEGPESALDIRNFGADFAVSTISANNFSKLKIPKGVKTVWLCYDDDNAGKANAAKAAKEYIKQIENVYLYEPYGLKDANEFRGK